MKNNKYTSIPKKFAVATPCKLFHRTNPILNIARCWRQLSLTGLGVGQLIKFGGWKIKTGSPARFRICQLTLDSWANLKSITHRCYLFQVAFTLELTKEIINLPRGCLQGRLSPRPESGSGPVSPEAGPTTHQFQVDNIGVWYDSVSIEANIETGLLFFYTLVTGPRRSLSHKLSNTRVVEPVQCYPDIPKLAQLNTGVPPS